MRRLRLSKRRRSIASLQIPYSGLFSVFLVTFGLIWALYMIFLWTALSCAEAVALTFGPSRHDVAVIDLFILAFLACFSLWFFNLARFRTAKQSWARRSVEFLLIGFCLLVSVTWAGTARPYHLETRVAGTVRDGLMRTPLFRTDVVMLDTVHPREVTEDGRAWFDDYDWNPHDVDARLFPFGIFTHPAERCRCWDNSAESTRQERFIIDWRESEGFISPAEAAELREIWPAPPREPSWCPAVLDLARPGS